MEKIYRVLIVDDEEGAISNLCYELKNYNCVSVIGQAHTGREGLKQVEAMRPDVLFLDVELPDCTGMEVVEKLRDIVSWQMDIIFYTAYNKYMIDALRANAFDFLLKPVDPDELRIIVTRFCERAATGTSSIPLPVESNQPFMAVTPTGDLRFLRVTEIGYFHYISSRKIWEIALTNGTFLPLRRNTTAEQLCAFDPVFIQVHQSYIINIRYLVMVQDNKCIMYPPFNKVNDLVVSKKYKKAMMDRFYQL